MNDRGAAMIEYALLVVLIAIIAIVTLSLVGDNIADMFGDVASELDQTPGP